MAQEALTSCVGYICLFKVRHDELVCVSDIHRRQVLVNEMTKKDFTSEISVNNQRIGCILWHLRRKGRPCGGEEGITQPFQ